MCTKESYSDIDFVLGIMEKNPLKTFTLHPVSVMLYDYTHRFSHDGRQECELCLYNKTTLGGNL